MDDTPDIERMTRPISVFILVLILCSLYFAATGVAMHAKVDAEEEAFHKLQEQYFLLDKATRDTAPENSELNMKLVRIKNTPSELLRLKLVGVGRILTGIYALLLGILIALVLMPLRLAALLRAMHPVPADEETPDEEPEKEPAKAPAKKEKKAKKEEKDEDKD